MSQLAVVCHFMWIFVLIIWRYVLAFSMEIILGLWMNPCDLFMTGCQLAPSAWAFCGDTDDCLPPAWPYSSVHAFVTYNAKCPATDCVRVGYIWRQFCRQRGVNRRLRTGACTSEHTTHLTEEKGTSGPPLRMCAMQPHCAHSAATNTHALASEQAHHSVTTAHPSAQGQAKQHASEPAVRQVNVKTHSG